MNVNRHCLASFRRDFGASWPVSGWDRLVCTLHGVRRGILVSVWGSVSVWVLWVVWVSVCVGVGLVRRAVGVITLRRKMLRLSRRDFALALLLLRPPRIHSLVTLIRWRSARHDCTLAESPLGWRRSEHLFFCKNEFDVGGAVSRGSRNVTFCDLHLGHRFFESCQRPSKTRSFLILSRCG